MNNNVLFVFLSEAPWQYYIQFEQYLHELQHPFKQQLHVLRDLRMEFPEALFKQYNVIAFFHHDPLESLYPKQYQYAKKLEALCKTNNIHLINRPDPLCNTTKSIQLKLLHNAGFNVAQSFSLTSTNDLFHIPLEFFPVFIRYDDGHDSKGLHVLGPFNSPLEAKEGLPNDFFKPKKHLKNYVAIQWINTCSSDGYFRKYRVYATPKHVLKGFLSTSSHWYIHWNNTLKTPNMFAEDAVYINSPVTEVEQRVFTDIIKLLNFDFGGIDYAYMPNGEIVIWEVNPHPSLGGTEEPIKSRVTNLLSSYYSNILTTKTKQLYP